MVNIIMDINQDYLGVYVLVFSVLIHPYGICDKRLLYRVLTY